MSSHLRRNVWKRRPISSWRALNPQFSVSNLMPRSTSSSPSSSPTSSFEHVQETSSFNPQGFVLNPYYFNCRNFASRGSPFPEKVQGPAAIDYRSALQEDEYQKLANSTIHDLLEKLEEYGDSLDIDGYDIDYGNEVLTVKLGNSGTYVINKQTPNRQIWMSSPVSGPSRFDWDPDAEAWMYRRTKANLLNILENELEKLCGQPIKLS